jgi:uncharacterized PurR-regulated membrane protein YhhQ (DUF165 family)
MERAEMIDAKTFVHKTFSGRIPWTYLYLFLIPFINWCFAAVPQIKLPDGGSWTPMAVVTGLVLVVRDFAQREVGHYIFIFLAIGLALSFVTSDPSIAMASTCAFFVGEIIDWALFTFLNMPLSKRVFISTSISAPVDSIVFYLMAASVIPGIFNGWSIASSVLSKLTGCVVVYFLIRNREKKAAMAAA